MGKSVLVFGEVLFDIFEKNHKESLVEYLCNSILEDDQQNKLALRKLADYTRLQMTTGFGSFMKKL